MSTKVVLDSKTRHLILSMKPGENHDGAQRLLGILQSRDTTESKYSKLMSDIRKAKTHDNVLRPINSRPSMKKANNAPTHSRADALKLSLLLCAYVPRQLALSKALFKIVAECAREVETMPQSEEKEEELYWSLNMMYNFAANREQCLLFAGVPALIKLICSILFPKWNAAVRRVASSALREFTKCPGLLYGEECSLAGMVDGVRSIIACFPTGLQLLPLPPKKWMVQGSLPELQFEPSDMFLCGLYGCGLVDAAAKNPDLVNSINNSDLAKPLLNCLVGTKNDTRHNDLIILAADALCDIMSELSSDTSVQTIICENSKDLLHLVEIMNTNNDETVKTKVAKIFRHICNTIGTVSFAQKIIDSGVVPALVKLLDLKKISANNDACNETAFALYISKGPTRHKRVIVKAGALAELVGILCQWESTLNVPDGVPNAQRLASITDFKHALTVHWMVAADLIKNLSVGDDDSQTAAVVASGAIKALGKIEFDKDEDDA